MSKQAEGFRILLMRPHLLWDHVKKTNGCWNWIGSSNKYGYGQIRVGQTSVLAHRAAFLLVKRYMSDGICVCHSCDNPSCCNPDHLFLGSHEENMIDMKIKGRRKNVNCGEANGRAKLTCDDSIEIRKERLEGRSLKELSEKYLVSKSSISRVCRMENWK